LIIRFDELEVMGEKKGQPVEKGWFKLDNAAKIYPAIITGELSNVFRITAYLNQPVRISSLIEAVKITSKRFPYFNVSLNNGAFWHYLETNDQLPRIHLEEPIPCTTFPIGHKKEVMYRILVRKNRISIESVHILTDGSGGLEYIKTLLFTYFKLLNRSIKLPVEIIDPDSKPDPTETEDAFKKYFQKKIPPSDKISKAWHLPFALSNKPRLRILQAELSVARIHEISKLHKVSITEYLVSVYMFTLQSIYLDNSKNKSKHIIRIQVPINLRKKYPSSTMRNFSLFVIPELDMRLGSYTFDEVTTIVHHYMQLETSTKKIDRIIARNVGGEKNLLIRFLPLFIKKIALILVYRKFGIDQFSGIFTNMGVIKLSGGLENYIKSFSLTPPPPNKGIKTSCAVISYQDTMMFVFANITKSVAFEKRFIRFLINEGINVKLVNND
jgi:NRPS condensation-like uncharacterized protein